MYIYYICFSINDTVAENFLQPAAYAPVMWGSRWAFSVLSKWWFWGVCWMLLWCCDADYMNSKHACVCGISYVNMSRFYIFEKQYVLINLLIINSHGARAMVTKTDHSASQNRNQFKPRIA